MSAALHSIECFILNAKSCAADIASHVLTAADATPNSFRDLCISSREIHKSVREIHIFLQEIHNPRREIHISWRKICISFFPPTQPVPVRVTFEARRDWRKSRFRRVSSALCCLLERGCAFFSPSSLFLTRNTPETVSQRRLWGTLLALGIALIPASGSL